MRMKKSMENIQQQITTAKKQADSDIKALNNIVDNRQSIEELQSKANAIQDQINKHNSSLTEHNQLMNFNIQKQVKEKSAKI